MAAIIREAREAYQTFENKDVLAIDIETSALRHWHGSIMVYNIADTDGNTAVIHTPSGTMPEPVEALLKQPIPRQWVTHNGTNFDWHWLRSYGIPIPPSHYDTLVGEQVLATTGRADIKKDLGHTMQRRLGYSSKGVADHSGWANRELNENQVAYAAGDVEELARLMLAQMELAEDRGLGEALVKEQYLTSIVAEIGSNGTQLDVEAFENLLIDQFEKAIAARERIGAWFNPNSPAQVKRYLHDNGCFVQDTKAATLNLLEEDFPIVKDIQIMKRAAKRSSMYSTKMLDEFADNDFLVRSMYWQTAAETTRMTSTDPNFQQIPRDMRGMFGSKDPGVRTVSSDFSQIEVRFVAEFSEDPELYIAIEDEDIHSNMARTMFNKIILVGDDRFRGKAGTFTWTFIGGIEGIQAMGALAGVYISDEEADEMIARLNARFKGVANWHRRIRVAANRRVVTIDLPWHHQRHLVGAKRRPQVICNTMVQGSAAAGMKEALFECHRRRLTPYISALIHDEIMGTNIPTAYAEEFGRELEEAMIEGMSKILQTVPVKVETTISSHWGK